MHVLILPSWYLTSTNRIRGIFFKEQAEALAESNIKVGLIAINDISLKEKNISFKLSEENINDVYTLNFQFPSIPKLKNLQRRINLFFFKKIFKVYKRKYGLPDIVHLHSFEKGNLALWLKKEYNIPYVITEHSSGFARQLYSDDILEYAKKTFFNASKRLAVSQQLEELLSIKFNLEFNYLPNIVNVNEFFLKSKKNKSNFTFINIAFLNNNKNQDMLIRAFYRAFKDKKNVNLVIVGDGPEYTKLKQLIYSLNMQKQITLYGRADREQVKNLLQNSDAFVLSSKYETFGVVIIEAMACGLPVVATKCGGPESIITSDRLGILCDIDEKNLSESMFRLYNNYNKYNSYEIRSFIIKNFSKDIIVKKLKRIYNEII